MKIANECTFHVYSYNVSLNSSIVSRDVVAEKVTGIF